MQTLTEKSKNIDEMVRATLVGMALVVAASAANFAGIRTAWSPDTLLLLAATEVGIIGIAAFMYFTAQRSTRRLSAVETWIDGLENVGFVRLTRAGKIATWARGASTVTGRQTRDVLGDYYTCLFSPEDIELKVPANLLRLAAGNGSCEHAAWSYRADGSRFWARFQITALYAEFRRVRGYSLIIHDETGRKLRDDHISDQHELMEAVVNGTFDIIFLKDCDGRYKLINAAGALSFGKRRDEIEGQSDRDLFAAAEAGRNQAADRSVIENGTAQVSEDEWMVGGVRRTFLTHKTPWRDHNGHVLGVIGIATDITERKLRAESERSLSRYRSAFMDAPIAYQEIDIDGVIRNVNRAHCEMLGREASELLGSAVWRFVAPHERHSTVSLLRRKIAGQADLIPFERTYMRPDGTSVCVTIHESRIVDEHGKIVGLRSALVEAVAHPRSRSLPLDVLGDEIAAVS